eukprot:COSAG03_NODE_15644_length_424_cov_1.215385_1_plen_42_part_01
MLETCANELSADLSLQILAHLRLGQVCQGVPVRQGVPRWGGE